MEQSVSMVTCEKGRAEDVWREPRRRSTIVVTESDARRLRALVRYQFLQGDLHEGSLGTGQLEAELMRATIVDACTLPADVVSMNSSLVCEDEGTGVWSRLRLVYPTNVRSHSDVSVLAPLGTALLGMTVGQVVEAKATGSGAKRLRIIALPYQPERAGDYHL